MMLDRVNGKNTLALLLFGFSLIIVLMIAITYQSLSQLGHSKSRLDNIVMVHNQKAALIGEMQHANRERIITLQHMLITDDFFELDEAAQENFLMASKFLEARHKLETMPRAPGEDALLKELRRFAAIGAPLNDQVRDPLWNEEENAHEKAINVLVDKVLPSQDRIYEVFDKLNRLYEAENELAVRNSAEEYETARGLILTMLQMTVMLGIGAALCVTVLILRNQKALENHRDTLETLVQDRTRDLERISRDAVRARLEAEDASYAKSTFLANMSHELRTPLNAVLGFSEIMDLQLMGPVPAEYREYPAHINDSARHLLQMIEQLLDMSKIEAGRIELNEQRVCLHSLLDETITIIRSAFSRDERTLVVSPDNTFVTLHADQRLLKQTLINIISNAAKYSEADDPVEVEVGAGNGDVVITVRDWGIGIAADEIPRLFNPYERSEAQTARMRQGTGLGLAISRSLIEVHGGTLTLESVLGEGTTVTITLPESRVIEVHRPFLDYAASA